MSNSPSAVDAAAAAEAAAAAASPYQNVTADQFKSFLLLELARRFKGVDPEVDARIDANAGRIMGRSDLAIKSIPGIVKGAPRVPFYLEGEPGVGKTSVIKAAVLEFCDIVGLNFVENPPDGQKIGPKDFYYAMVNLSGKNNTMDLGGIPTKSALDASRGVELRRRAQDAGAWLLAEAESRAKAVALFAKLGVSEPKFISKGDLSGTELTITGDSAQVDVVLQTVVRQLGDEVKKHGVGLALLKDGEEPMDGRLYLQLKKGTAGARLTAWAPQMLDADDAYVCEMLPNRRFAIAKDAKFSLFNFDDVANSSEAVRNVLLEVAQMNRYSGVMDLGNALVSFTGNMGSEDNTNTQSEQSDAEVTRVVKLRICDTPTDWARRTAAKYSSFGGDCYMGAFIQKYGNDPGVFREAMGDGRSAKGIPKVNSRSLENAVSMILPYFQMAKESGVGETVFSDAIEAMVKGTVGSFVATKYMAFLKAMLSQAMPLADELLKTGKLDMERLQRYQGAGAKASDRDFAFRFGTALADAFVERIAYSEGARTKSADKEATQTLITEATERLCIGLSHVEPGVMNQSLSRVMARLGSVATLASTNGQAVTLSTDTYMAMANGFSAAANNGVWPDPKSAEKDFLALVSGSNHAGTPKAKAKKP
jgi:hypothetical protein